MSGTSLVEVARQRGWVIQPDTATHIHRIDVRSESSANLYRISQTRKNGVWMCECLGFRLHRRCKHLKAIVPVIEATLANPARPQQSPAARKEPAPPPPRKIAAPVRQITRPKTATVAITFDSKLDEQAIRSALVVVLNSSVAKGRGIVSARITGIA